MGSKRSSTPFEQKGTRRVIGGNGRLVAMRELGWRECDVVELDLDDLTASSRAIRRRPMTSPG